ESFRARVEIVERAVRLQPAVVSWRRDLFWSRSALGDALLSSGDRTGAIAAFAAARDDATANGGGEEWARLVSVADIRIGDALLGDRRPAEALVRFQAAHAVRARALAAAPDDRARMRDRRFALERVVNALLALERVDEALIAGLDHLALAQRIVEGVPPEMAAFRDLTRAHYKLARAHQARGDLPAAEEAAKQAIAVVDQRLATFPNDAQARPDREFLLRWSKGLHEPREKQFQIDLPGEPLGTPAAH
ncbi:MAG: hypothetical protein AB7O45_07195, partial [Alphaproteobacteria bacterium]